MIEISWSEQNRLAGSGSPYLEQHAENPVHWIPWSDAVFEEARRRDSPILVSIGYSTCHWCHVMAHESFENQAVASVMNKALVNVKVDREQHPGVDAVYMEAAQVLNGSGGWPLNVFIDHDGRPFLAVTYMPSDRWADLVTEVHHIWSDERERIHDVTGQLAERLAERPVGRGADTARWPERYLAGIAKHYDEQNPGFGSGPSGMKFPPSQGIDWMLEHGGDEGRSMGLDILTAMMDSGLHDRVGGGFHRYSVEPKWRIPHFEKMTYDNAQLMGLYARASILAPGEPLRRDFMTAARSTADWLLQDMRITDRTGAFTGYATATDADDPLGEGTFFAWPPSELISVLGEEDGAWLTRRWNLSGEGKLPASTEQGHYEPNPDWIPHPRGSDGYPDSYRGTSIEDRQKEETLKQALRTARAARPAPYRDEKVLTDQNALVLEGLVRLARYGGGEKYNTAAVELAEFLTARFRLGERLGDGSRSEEGGQTIHRLPGTPAYITDYGYLAMALAGVYSLTGRPVFALAAEQTAEEAVARFSTGSGDYFSTPDGDESLYKRPIEEFDGPSPAGQYALGIAFARLYAVTGESIWKERIDRLLDAQGRLVELAPVAAATLVRLGSIRAGFHTLVVAGSQDRSETDDLLNTVKRVTGPDVMIVAADQAGAAGVQWTELEGRVGLDESQLLVCRDGRCLLPAKNPSQAIARLKTTGLTISES